MSLRLAFYKGPATKPLHKFGHWAICTFTGSPYSHVELVIDGWCWTSSSRDGGVRRKAIDLRSGKWDVIDIPGDAAAALRWFEAHDGEGYDWIGVLHFALPFLPKRSDKSWCSEAVAAALGLPDPEMWTPAGLAAHYLALASWAHEEQLTTERQ